MTRPTLGNISDIRAHMPVWYASVGLHA
ncbi:hypothetical protein F383_14658 [Gossypium arboreum]|uniref:Uncharacterized protein n=1 Tax=Gossypium arboreum TaxID=29729 RepID=A0A0B0PUY6_GOSAR|nr:hypothetical protein F383_14658 [Gossypium arboreum]